MKHEPECEMQDINKEGKPDKLGISLTSVHFTLQALLHTTSLFKVGTTRTNRKE